MRREPGNVDNNNNLIKNWKWMNALAAVDGANAGRRKMHSAAEWLMRITEHGAHVLTYPPFDWHRISRLFTD